MESDKKSLKTLSIEAMITGARISRRTSMFVRLQDTRATQYINIRMKPEPLEKCTVCLEEYDSTQVVSVCSCQKRCRSCLDNEGTTVYQNRGVIANVSSMLTCAQCKMVRDIDLYKNLSEAQRLELKHVYATSKGKKFCPTCTLEYDEDNCPLCFIETEEASEPEIKINYCPGCGTAMERDEGCYHMTCRNCPGRRGQPVEFCDCCNSELHYVHGMLYDSDNVPHYPNTVYSPCRLSQRIQDDATDGCDCAYCTSGHPDQCFHEELSDSDDDGQQYIFCAGCGNLDCTCVVECTCLYCSTGRQHMCRGGCTFCGGPHGNDDCHNFCVICGQNGHNFNQCPENRHNPHRLLVCRYCEKQGHMQRNCPFA